MTSKEWLTNELKKGWSDEEIFYIFKLFDQAKEMESEEKKKIVDETLKDYHIVDTNEMVSSQTEISDEEIFKGILKHCSIPHDRILAEVNAMIDGAKWYREQLKQNNGTSNQTA